MNSTSGWTNPAFVDNWELRMTDEDSLYFRRGYAFSTFFFNPMIDW